MAASKPISQLYLIETSLISLNINFGTLTLVLGCFPLDIQPQRTMSDNSAFIFPLPSANTLRQNLTQIPRYMQKNLKQFYSFLLSYFVLKKVEVQLKKTGTIINTNCLRSQFCTCYDVNLNCLLIQVSQKTSYPSQICLSLTYHNSSDIFTTITRSDFYNPDRGKITRLRV